MSGLTHPRSGCVGILTTRGLWYRICPQRGGFNVPGMGRRGAAVLPVFLFHRHLGRSLP